MGTKDRLGKVMAYNRQWSETVGVNITWIENAGHNSNDDEPVKVNEAIERFIEDTCAKVFKYEYISYRKQQCKTAV